jgi:hypothetical protein
VVLVPAIEPKLTRLWLKNLLLDLVYLLKLAYAQDAEPKKGI